MTDFTQYSNAYRYTRFERRDGCLFYFHGM